MRSRGRSSGARFWGSPGLTAKEPDFEGAGSRRTWIGDAMSWLMACVIEGFTAYANSHYPWQYEEDQRLAAGPMQSERHDGRQGSLAAPVVGALSGTFFDDWRKTNGR